MFNLQLDKGEAKSTKLFFINKYFANEIQNNFEKNLDNT